MPLCIWNFWIFSDKFFYFDLVCNYLAFFQPTSGVLQMIWVYIFLSAVICLYLDQLCMYICIFLPTWGAYFPHLDRSISICIFLSTHGSVTYISESFLLSQFGSFFWISYFNTWIVLSVYIWTFSFYIYLSVYIWIIILFEYI